MTESVQQVISVSLGSSARDHRTSVELCGKRFDIWREGCDNDKDRLIARLIEVNADPQVAAVGLGGMDFFLDSADRQFWFREVRPLKQYVPDKPFVGGTGLKVAFEKNTAKHMIEEFGLDIAGKKVLCMCGLDRWGLACGFSEAGAQVSYGDLLWALGLPIMIRSKAVFVPVVRTIAPLAVQLPYKMLYDANADHTTQPTFNKTALREYRDADIIAGDYKFVMQHMTEDMEGKWVVTNTTTEKDIEFLRQKGIELVVTTTPRFEGRSFGTNLIEACLIAAEGASEALHAERYVELAKECGLAPSIVYL
jgi:hypothetical protein